jgi:hypothetical protein
LATTGSNTFVGNQIVSGSFRVSGSIESSYDNLGAEGGQLILRGPVNRYNVDNWSGNALRIFREDDATAANGNVIIFASGSGQVGINKNSTNATLDVNGNALVSGSLTTTGNVNVNSDGIVINRSTSGEPYLFFRKDGVNRGSIYGADNTSGLRFFVGDSNLTLTLTSGSAAFNANVGIGVSGPSFPLEVTTNTASATTSVASFHNLDYTTGTKTFIRVRTQTNAGSSFSSFFGTGQDGTLHIVANDFARGGDIKINPFTGNITTSGTINGLSLPNDLFAQQFLLMGS